MAVGSSPRRVRCHRASIPGTISVSRWRVMDKHASRQALVLAAAAKGTNSIYRYRARPWLGSLPPDVANRICLHMASMRPHERSAAAGGGVEWTPVDYSMASGDRPIFLDSYGALRSTCRALRDFSNNGRVWPHDGKTTTWKWSTT